MKKLLLASAIAAAATSASALEAMSDSAMSETTGQDGLTINMSIDASANLLYIDRDNGGAGELGGGALSMTNTITGDVSLVIDVDDNGTEQALVIGATASNLDIGVGGISVGAVANGEWTATSLSADTILDPIDVTISNLDATIALDGGDGYSVSGGSTSLANLALTIDTLTVTGISINDTNGYTGTLTTVPATTGVAGSLDIGQVDITGVSLNSDIDIDGDAGIVLELNSLTLDVKVTDIGLNGDSNNIIGDVALNNLNLSGTAITINGH